MLDNYKAVSIPKADILDITRINYCCAKLFAWALFFLWCENAHDTTLAGSV